MRTQTERLARMHRRAKELRRRRDRSLLRVWGGVSGALLICLLALAAVFPTGHGLAGDGSAASSLLADSAGGYVLIGVLAFMLGVVITVVILRKQNRERM